MEGETLTQGKTVAVRGKREAGMPVAVRYLNTGIRAPPLTVSANECIQMDQQANLLLAGGKVCSVTKTGRAPSRSIAQIGLDALALPILALPDARPTLDHPLSAVGRTTSVLRPFPAT